LTPLADFGTAIENILLAAVKKGIGTCWIGSVRRGKFVEVLSVSETYSIEYAIARLSC